MLELRSRLVETLVDAGHLLRPPEAVPMLHVEQLLMRPVEVVGQEGQLPVQAFFRVDGYAPTAAIASPGSTSNVELQLGQATSPREPPPSLMRR